MIPKWFTDSIFFFPRPSETDPVVWRLFAIVHFIARDSVAMDHDLHVTTFHPAGLAIQWNTTAFPASFITYMCDFPDLWGEEFFGSAIEHTNLVMLPLLQGAYNPTPLSWRPLIVAPLCMGMCFSNVWRYGSQLQSKEPEMVNYLRAVFP